MALNSLDVQNKTFNPQFRGFSKHEVDEFWISLFEIMMNLLKQ